MIARRAICVQVRGPREPRSATNFSLSLLLLPGTDEPKTIGGRNSMNQGMRFGKSWKFGAIRQAGRFRQEDGIVVMSLDGSRVTRSDVVWMRNTRSRIAQAHCSPKYWATSRKFLPPYKYTGCEESGRGARRSACSRWLRSLTRSHCVRIFT